MYSVDLKNIVPKGGLTCLFAKATSDESKLWHRRLGHLNFKTMNKLVKGNIVRGLPSKLFENDQTCVACQKGKQHRASCKSKTENSISLPLHLLHMDLFGPTFVKSLMKKMYCLVVTDDYSRFTWVFFLATKDETSGILKSFITGIENLVDHKVKVHSLMVLQVQKQVIMQVKLERRTEPVKDYILLPLWTTDPPFSQDPKSSHDDGSKPSSDDGKKVDEDPRKDSECNDQEKEDNVNSTNNVNAASTNEVNVVDDEDDGVVADMNNLDTTIQVSPIPTTRIHKDHPLDQVIGDLQSATQTRKMSKNLEEHGFEEPKKVIHALKDPSWIEAMQEELLQFKLQEVWTLVDLPNGKRAIGSKWVFRNKKDERGIVIRNKRKIDTSRITPTPTQRRWDNYIEGEIEEECMYVNHQDLKIQTFLIEYTRLKKHYMDYIKLLELEVKTASTPMETQKPLLKDEDDEEVDVHMYRYLKGQPGLGLWYPKDSPFDLVAYTNSDYAGASLDRKSTTGGKAKKSVRLMMEKLFNRIGVNTGDSKLMLLGITYYRWF
ncbi:putative ribonuclease H-like domain-containing protein [Tanacetum coccineum]